MYYDIFTSQTKPNFNHTPLIFNVQISLSIKFNLQEHINRQFWNTFPLKYSPTKYFLVSLKCILIVILSISSSIPIPLNLSIKIINVKHWKTEEKKNIPPVIILFVLSKKDDSKNNKGIQLKTFLTNTFHCFLPMSNDYFFFVCKFYLNFKSYYRTRILNYSCKFIRSN